MKNYLPIILCLITYWLDGPPILYLFYIILFWIVGKLDTGEKKNSDSTEEK
jgi:hypothetical protein